MKNKRIRQEFALCLNNRGYEVSLELGKLYRVIEDEEATERGYIRVVDESGEGYTYDADRFFILELPEQVEEALLSST